MNKEVILRGISKAEDKLLVARILDKYTLSQKIMSYTHSDFLDLISKMWLENVLK